MNHGISRRRFDNGVPLVTESISQLRSVTLGVWVHTGSRDELPHEHGISHFLEHTFFKGTPTRNARQIAEQIDAMGGEMNAFTGREQTGFYVKVLSDRLNEAADLLMDVLTQSSFPPEELDRERQVIVEEIRMVEDDPEEWIHDLHGEHMWGKKAPLGRTILGTEASVTGMGPDQIRAYLARRYTADRIVISAAGNLDADRLFDRLAPAVASFGSDTSKVGGPVQANPALAADSGTTCLQFRELEQVHLCLGSPGLPQGHPDRFIMHVLNDLLGGGASSRLFQEIREKRGLAYSVYSGHTGYRDCGEMTIYAGCGPDSIDPVVGLIQDEIERLCTIPVESKELARIKGHLKGTLMLSLEGTFNRMTRLAQDEIIHGAPQPLDDLLTGIDRVTSEQLTELARRVFRPAPLCATVLGNLATPPDSLSLDPEIV